MSSVDTTKRGTQAAQTVTKFPYDGPTKKKERFTAPEGGTITGSIYLTKEKYKESGSPAYLNIEVSTPED